MSIQMSPAGDADTIVDKRDAKEYLKQYFDKVNFDVYWGEAPAFVRELWEQWEG